MAKGNSSSYQDISSERFHRKLFSKTLRNAKLACILQFGNQIKPDWTSPLDKPSTSPPHWTSIFSSLLVPEPEHFPTSS